MGRTSPPPRWRSTFSQPSAARAPPSHAPHPPGAGTIDAPSTSNATDVVHPLWLQLVNAAVFAVVFAVNGLAGSGAMSGASIGEIANRYASSFLPAGYVFSIWSLIYLWLAAFVVYQLLPGQRGSAALGRLGLAWAVNGALNVLWIVTFSFALFWPAWLTMIGLLVSLVWIHERVGFGRASLSRGERFLVAYPFGLYLAWISVALISNTFQLANYVEWTGFGIDGPVWSVVMMIVGAGLATFMVVHRGNWLFPPVFAWAYIGLAVRYPDASLIADSAYVLACATLLAMIGGLAWRRRRGQGTAAAAILAALAMTLAGCGSGNGAPDEAAGVDTLTVLAYNIHHGEGMDSVLDLKRIAGLIDGVDPDLVALQEIDSVTARTGGVDQAAELGRLTGLTPVFGRFMAYQGGSYGMALLSRWPIAEWTNHRLPDGEEPRSAVGAVVTAPNSGRQVRFVGVHFYRTDDERLAQARALDDLLADDTLPAILAGDFNSTPDSDVMAFLARSWHVVDKGADRLTFSSWDPVREIDYVLVRPAERFQVIHKELLHEPVASDHRPVLVRFVLR